MKPTKMRNQMIYRATAQTRSKQLGSPLSKELQKKYGKRSARVTKGDSVIITRGEFKGVEGKVEKVSIEKNSVAVAGIKKEATKGEKYDVYIHTSNVRITGLNTDDKWRMKKLGGNEKTSESKSQDIEKPSNNTKEMSKKQKKERQDE